MQASSLQKKAVVKSAAQNLPFHLSNGFWWSLPASALVVSCSKPQVSTDKTIAEKGFHSRSQQSLSKRLWDGKKSSSMSITAFASDPAVLQMKNQS